MKNPSTVYNNNTYTPYAALFLSRYMGFIKHTREILKKRANKAEGSRVLVKYIERAHAARANDNDGP